MKKLLALFLTMIFVLSLAACGEEPAPSEESKDESSQISESSEVTASDIASDIEAIKDAEQDLKDIWNKGVADIKDQMGLDTESSSNPPVPGVRQELKEFLDSYEECIDAYVKFMTDYNANPSGQASMMLDYLKITKEYTEMCVKADDWNSADLNDEEISYFNTVMERCSKKIVDAAIDIA